MCWQPQDYKSFWAETCSVWTLRLLGKWLYVNVCMTVICKTICSSIASRVGHVKTIIFSFLSFFLNPLLWFIFRAFMVCIVIAFLTISVFLLLLFLFLFFLSSCNELGLSPYFKPSFSVPYLSSNSRWRQSCKCVENKLQKLQKISHLW